MQAWQIVVLSTALNVAKADWEDLDSEEANDMIRELCKDAGSDNEALSEDSEAAEILSSEGRCQHKTPQKQHPLCSTASVRHSCAASISLVCIS
jgi:hypothetical protein